MSGKISKKSEKIFKHIINKLKHEENLVQYIIIENLMDYLQRMKVVLLKRMEEVVLKRMEEKVRQ